MFTTHLKCFVVNRFYQKNIADELKTTNLKTRLFYIISKVRKKDILEWPVVSSIDFHTSKFSKFVNHYL